MKLRIKLKKQLNSNRLCAFSCRKYLTPEKLTRTNNLVQHIERSKNPHEIVTIVSAKSLGLRIWKVILII